MNFGPLNGKGGERRLNVAVSRARKEMMVFAILRPEQIDLSRSNARGVEGLKRFLEFARSGQIALSGSQLGIQAEDGIAGAVAEEIRRMGYEADTSVGRSNFRVDIAVSDPKDRDRYILGILCDGEGYYRTKTERDREIVQPSVLRGLGWRLIRVWSVDWFVNREKETARIREALDEAVRAGGCRMSLRRRLRPCRLPLRERRRLRLPLMRPRMGSRSMRPPLRLLTSAARLGRASMTSRQGKSTRPSSLSSRSQCRFPRAI